LAQRAFYRLVIGRHSIRDALMQTKARMFVVGLMNGMCKNRIQTKVDLRKTNQYAYQAPPGPRRVRIRSHHLLFLFVLCVSLRLAGQALSQDHVSPARNGIEVVGAATLADGALESATVDRRLFVFGVTYSRVLTHRRVLEARFTSEAIPMALLREPFLTFASVQAVTSNRFSVMRETYGFGASPVGIEIDWLPHKKIQPFFGVQGGFLRFDRNALDFLGAKFNFTIDGRGGVRIALPHEKSISVAYAFEHMSNAYLARGNPGLDAHMISVTYRVPLRFHSRTH
jgi:hypothetical protein